MKLKELAKLVAAKIVPEMTVNYGAIKLRGPLEDRGFLKALSKNQREPFMVQELLNEVGPGTIFLDIGGHLGHYSLSVAKKLVGLGSGRVFVFEPHARSRKYLTENVSLNGLGSLVTIESSCVSDRDGTLTLYSDSLQSDYTSTVLNAEGSSQRTVTTVPAVSADSYFVDKSTPSLIKVDVEGAELAVLKGMDRILTKQQPTLFIESNDRALRKAGASAMELVAALRAYYSRIYIVDESSKTLLPVTDGSKLTDQCVNLLCKSL